MSTLFSEFHFLRPWWFIALAPAIGLCILLWQQKKRRSAWQGFIDANLLKYLIEAQVSTTFRWQIIAVSIAWIISCFALAGPSWQKIPQPVHQPEAAVVILLDLSPSMAAEDIKPSRLVRMRYKAIDFLNARTEGVTALIAYAGEAHVVSPLTDDINTINNLLPALEPSMMPLPGSNIEMAVELAVSMFADAGIHRGEILAVTDGIEPNAFDYIKQQLKGSNFHLSIMGVGSTQGAPIPTGNGGFLKDRSRNIVVAKLNRDELRQLSAELGGTYVDLRADDNDIDALISAGQRLNPQDDQRLLEREFDVWLDQGQWLALFLLPFIAIAFRKGWLLGFLLIGILHPEPTYAFEWRDLWLRKDQQGQLSMESGDPTTAAQEFQSPEWKGTANYRAENFEEAANAFSLNDGAVDQFNRGNALAKAGNLEEALEAYDAALKQHPDFEDAEFNSGLVKELLEQQKQEQEDQQDQQQDDDQNQQENQQADNSQQDSQQNQDNQQQDGQQSDQQSQQQSDQQNGQEPQGINEEAAQELAAKEQQGEQLTEEQKQQLKEWRESQEQNADQSPEESGEPKQMLAENAERQTEEEQALEQWLRQVPDDPSGLMRRKFQYQRQRRIQEYQRNQWAPPENGALERY